MNEMKYPLRPGLPPLPERIAQLPVDERGYPVPWFVAWLDGKPEFRCMAPGHRTRAVRDKLCWVCGQKLGAHMVFVLGPMCSINRISAEPPSHRECAEFSVKACPFLTKPHMTRRDNDLPEEACNPAGMMITRNPGAMALWGCRKYSIVSDGRGGQLIEVGSPEWVSWWAEGRKATRAEVDESIRTGMPILMAEAEKQGPGAIAELQRLVRVAKPYLPKE